jgi:hypothetical protein
MLSRNCVRCPPLKYHGCQESTPQKRCGESLAGDSNGSREVDQREGSRSSTCQPWLAGDPGHDGQIHQGAGERGEDHALSLRGIG